MAPRLLICFDGSPGSEHAIAEAARLFPGAEARVVFAWQAPLRYGSGFAYGQAVLPGQVWEELSEQAAAHAQALADRGAALATAAGLASTGIAAEATGPPWELLLGAADDASADLVVAGSRGLGEIKAVLLGSTSQALAHHSRLPLLIVPEGGSS